MPQVEICGLRHWENDVYFVKPCAVERQPSEPC